jgi:ferric-dicitrate binding protein FerR (iron transport regulator)
MSSRRIQREIDDFALRASQGALRPEDRARLNELLESSDEACRALLLSFSMDADLITHVRAEAAEERVLTAISGGREAADRASGRWRMASMHPLRWAVAATVVGMAAWFAVRTSESDPKPVTFAARRSPRPIASLVKTPDMEFADGKANARDVLLEGDSLSIVRGEAHISMSSGADFVLTSPGIVEFISAREVRLRQGVLTAQVAKWGLGFTVDTDAMRVTDLGTQFAVSAFNDDVETHVLKGQVRVQPLGASLKGRRSVLLSEGEALRVDRNSVEPVRMAAERMKFATVIKDFRPFKPIAMHNTGAGLAEGDEDSHWRVTKGPIGAAYRGPQFAVVCVPDVRYATNDPKRSQWISLAKDVRPGGLPNSAFTFETSFDLTGFDLSTVTVAAEILADNGVHAIRVNGVDAGVRPWVDNVPQQYFKKDGFHVVRLKRGFIPGKNKIEIDVWNGVYQVPEMLGEPNPVAIRAEFQAFGRLRGEAATVPDEIARQAPVGAGGTSSHEMPNVQAGAAAFDDRASATVSRRSSVDRS